MTAVDSPTLKHMHDSELMLVSVDARKRTMRLDFQLEDGRQCSITMHELTEFRCEGLSRQNIVNEICQSCRGEISDEDVDSWKNWVRGFTDSFNDTAEDQERSWFNRLKRGETNLVVIESSTGVTLAGVCEKLIVSDPAC